MGDPLTIYQDLLDILSRAVLEGDVETCHRHLALPLTSSTLHCTEVIDTSEGLTTYINAFVNWLRVQRATDYVRLAREAAYLDRHRIEGTHYTHVISGSHRVIPPYASRMVIAWSGSHWQVTEAVHALDNSRFPIHLPETGPHSEQPPLRLHG